MVCRYAIVQRLKENIVKWGGRKKKNVVSGTRKVKLEVPRLVDYAKSGQGSLG